MHIPIHVGIPVYNNASDLRLLLRQLTAQNFASITVLDDASTDNLSEMLEEFPTVQCVRSEANLGTIGANNLMLKKMPSSGYILFIDSDMQMVTADIPKQLSNFITQHPNIGAGVGWIKTAEGDTLRWNYGYDINPWRDILAGLTYYPALLFRKVPGINKITRALSLLFTQHLADSSPKKIDWGIEAFFFVKADLFQKLGGFDTRFKRFHEGPDLFLQIRKVGYETWFTPSIVARDLDQNTGTSWYRRYHKIRSTVIYFWKNPDRLLIYKYPRP